MLLFIELFNLCSDKMIKMVYSGGKEIYVFLRPKNKEPKKTFFFCLFAFLTNWSLKCKVVPITFARHSFVW